MPGSNRCKIMHVAVAAAAIGTLVSCERLSETETGRPAQAVTRVLVVRPERHTVQRAIGEPGSSNRTRPRRSMRKSLVTFAVCTSTLAQRSRRVNFWPSSTFRRWTRKSNRSARRSDKPRRKRPKRRLRCWWQAGVSTALAKLAEVRAGINRAEAELSRWQSETNRVTQLVSDRAASRSLLDETTSKLHAAESVSEEVRAHVKSAEAAVIESRALLDRASADVVASLSSIDFAREDARRAWSAARLHQDRGAVRWSRHSTNHRHGTPDQAWRRCCAAVRHRSA